jgi:Skp family chaperone for outer membrane proteins
LFRFHCPHITNNQIITDFHLSLLLKDSPFSAVFTLSSSLFQLSSVRTANFSKVGIANNRYALLSQEIQRDAEEAHASKNDVLTQNKDLEKKIKSLEADLVQCQEDTSAAERARRTAENERDELAEELSNSGSKGSLALDEKRRLDAR